MKIAKRISIVFCLVLMISFVAEVSYDFVVYGLQHMHEKSYGMGLATGMGISVLIVVLLSLRKLAYAFVEAWY